MRKLLFPEGEPASVIIVQEKVYNSVGRISRSDFIEFDLAEKSLTVRDNPAAKKVYYKLIEADTQAARSA